MKKQNSDNRVLSEHERSDLLEILRDRFEKYPQRHQHIEWQSVSCKLAESRQLWSLYAMEQTGGEPDIVGYDKESESYLFFDCSAESPSGRRGVCYDRAGLESRKSHPPEQNAVDMAASMGIELLTAEQYRYLQQLGDFDTRTSSWLRTPPAIRKLGGALFGDRRYDHVFIYHNGAGSYYGVRAFRGCLSI